jgi:hypothetical protein
MGNKLGVAKPSVRAWSYSSSSIRAEEVIVTWLRIGHTGVTHGHLLRGDPALLHYQCDVPLTILHILYEFRRHGAERQAFHLHVELRYILMRQSPLRV